MNHIIKGTIIAGGFLVGLAAISAGSGKISESRENFNTLRQDVCADPNLERNIANLSSGSKETIQKICNGIPRTAPDLMGRVKTAIDAGISLAEHR